MKVIHIPQYQKNLLFFEKSGSSLMAGFFKSLLDWKGVRITDKVTGNNWTGENILFVRNPSERLVSIFYHLNIVKGTDMTVGDKIVALDKFLDGYADKCKTSNNSHLQPQSWDYERRESDVIIKVEDIRDGYNRLISRYQASSNISFNTTSEFFTKEQYHTDFGFIENLGIELDDKDRFFTVTLYDFIINRLNGGHHHNESHLMLGWLKHNGRRDILEKLTNITKDEMERFGYNSSSII